MTYRFHPAAIAIAGLLTATGFAQQVMAVGQQSPRRTNIQNAVLALNAAEFCRAMPYTIAQAQGQIVRMRADPDTSILLDELISNYNGQYQLALTGAGHEDLCASAATIGVI